MRKIISRPNPGCIPSLPLPIHVRSAGYNEAAPGWSEFESRDRKNFVQIFWCNQGIGEFRFEDRNVLLHPNEVIYRLPHEEHSHRSADPKIPWHYHWFTFDGPNAKAFMLSYGYPQTNLHAGPCPIRMFQELETLLSHQTIYAQRHAVSIATEILALAGCSEGRIEHDVVKRFLEISGQRFSDENFTVAAAAAELEIHRTTLYRIFKQELGFSPKQYLRRLRIQKALSLLLETELPVKVVAAESGFNKVDYFCSVIAGETGLTPMLYRKHTAVDS